MIAKITAFIAALIAALGLLQAPPTEAWEPDSADVTALAQTLYGECRGCSEIQQKAVCQVVLNRVDDPRFPDTSLWKVLDNKDAAKKLQKMLDEIDD